MHIDRETLLKKKLQFHSLVYHIFFRIKIVFEFFLKKDRLKMYPNGYKDSSTVISIGVHSFHVRAFVVDGKILQNNIFLR